MKSEFYGTEIFLDNEATREYLDICRGALARPEPDYYETHMVIPMEYWRFLPWSVKGKLKEAMPENKKTYCKLLPEEHFRCHELIHGMVSDETKPSSGLITSKVLAQSLFKLVKEAHQGKHQTAVDYAEAQRKRNGGKNWDGFPELMKYHPERFNADGSPRGV